MGIHVTFYSERPKRNIPRVNGTVWLRREKLYGFAPPDFTVLPAKFLNLTGFQITFMVITTLTNNTFNKYEQNENNTHAPDKGNKKSRVFFFYNNNH